MKHLRTFVLLPLLAASLQASTTYTYVGAAFNQFFGVSGDTTANFITASVTLASPLTGSMSLGPVSPTSWSISDGTHSLDSTSLGIAGTLFEFGTNPSGSITAWIVNVATNAPSFIGLQTYSSEVGYNDGVETVNSFDLYANRLVNGTDASTTTAAGMWTQSAVPEPSTMLPLAALLTWFAWRRWNLFARV